MAVKCRAWEGIFTPCGWSPVLRQRGLEKAFPGYDYLSNPGYDYLQAKLCRGRAGPGTVEGQRAGSCFLHAPLSLMFVFFFLCSTFELANPEGLLRKETSESFSPKRSLEQSDADSENVVLFFL